MCDCVTLLDAYFANLANAIPMIYVALSSSFMHPFCIAPQEDFSIGAANDFIQEFKEGTLKPTVMSKRVPKKSKAALKEVVGKTIK